MTTRSVTILAAMLALLLPAAPAQAQNFTSFVSFAGSDGNSCTRASPCFSLGAAAAKTQDGGMVLCLDSGPFDAGTISKSVIIDCAGTSAVTRGFTITSPASTVTIRNLTINGAGLAGFGIDATIAVLYVENCTITNLNSGGAIGIRFRPSSAGSQLNVSDTVLKENGIGLFGAGGGIQVAPQAGGSAGVVLNRVNFTLNTTAMVLNSSNGPIGAVMRESMVSASAINGIQVIAGQSNTLTIAHSGLLNNVGNAIQAVGAGSLVLLDDSTITGNETGVGVSSGGTMLSYKNNRLFANNNNGPPPAAVPGVSGPMF